MTRFMRKKSKYITYVAYNLKAPFLYLSYK